MTDKAADSVRGVADQAGQVASRVADQARDVGDALEDVSGNLKAAVDKSLKDRPMATLAVVAVLGFVLGAIWKTQRQCIVFRKLINDAKGAVGSVISKYATRVSVETTSWTASWQGTRG